MRIAIEGFIFIISRFIFSDVVVAIRIIVADTPDSKIISFIFTSLYEKGFPTFLPMAFCFIATRFIITERISFIIVLIRLRTIILLFFQFSKRLFDTLLL